MKNSFENILLSDEFQHFVSLSNEERLNNPLHLKAQEDQEFSNALERALRYHEFLSNHKNVKFPDEQKYAAEQQLLAKINQENKTKRLMNSTSTNGFIYTLFKMVAGIVVLVSLTILVSQSGFIKNIVTLDKNSEEFNTIVVPSGEKTKVVLTDGTIIWLNSESELKYKAGYNSDDNRTVYLKGEGYFDVARHKSSEFMVVTDNLKVKALGTVFNVKSYPNDKTVETTLIEGSVEIEKNKANLTFEKTQIRPEERFVLHMNTLESDVVKARSTDEKSNNRDKKQEIPSMKHISISKVNTDNIISWKDHLLVFDNETLDDIAIKLSRWYKLRIQIVDEGLKKERYTGRFVNNETVYQVLEAINITTPITYEANKDTIEIGYQENNK